MFVDPVPHLATWAAQSRIHPVTETRGPALWIVTPVFLFAAIFCVAVRLYSRIFIRKWFGVDDLLILLALLFSIAVTVCLAVVVERHKWDHHAWALSIDDYAPSVKMFYVMNILWGMGSLCVRLSVLCLFYRLAKSSQAPAGFFWILHATLAFNLALMLFVIFNGVFPCRPIRNFWAWPSIEGAHCLDEGKILQAIAIVNTIGEFILATLPLLGVFKLGVGRGQRLGVICLLCLGFMVGLIGCVRSYYVCVLFTGDLDITWWVYPQYVCSEVEIYLAIICACAAPLRPFVRRVHRLLGTHKVASPWPTQQTRSTRKSEATDYSRDYEAMAEWQSEVNRVVDIEGISSNNYAYTVVISGPAPRSNPALARLGLRSRDRRRSHITDSKLRNNELTISHETEVTVESSGNRFGLFGPSCAKMRSPYVDQIEIYGTLDKAKRSHAFEEGLEEIELSNVVPLDECQGSVEANRLEDIVTALPEIPLAVAQARKRVQRFPAFLRRPA